jgi:hypothetical protein
MRSVPLFPHDSPTANLLVGHPLTKELAVNINRHLLVIGIFELLASAAALARDPQLLLKHGTYVSNGERCKDSSNANLLSWDGVGFAGAHSSKCSSAIVHHHGARYQVATTCSALGDGSPNVSGHDYSDSFLLRRLSVTAFEVVKPKQLKRTYRWGGVTDPA